MSARSTLARVGFAGPALDLMTGISYGECRKHTAEGQPLQGYLDAVGDWQIITPTPEGEVRPPTWTPYSEAAALKWMSSLNFCQIRCLIDPYAWGVADRVRDARKIHLDPEYCAYAAWIISRQGTYFEPWSVYKNIIKPVLDQGKTHAWVSPTFDFQLVTGHPEADRWATNAPADWNL